MIGSAAFVDKTLLIKDFVKSGDKVVLITCPRRFGKSTNMSMIKVFLEMEVNHDGLMIRINNLAKKNLFEKHAKLNIMQESDILDNYFAQHPVIFVNFLNATGNTRTEIKNSIRREINNAFEEHSYMNLCTIWYPKS